MESNKEGNKNINFACQPFPFQNIFPWWVKSSNISQSRIKMLGMDWKES